MVRSKAAVGFFVTSDMAEDVFTSDNLVVHILNKDPQIGKNMITNILAASEDPKLSQIRKLASYELQA